MNKHTVKMQSSIADTVKSRMAYGAVGLVCDVRLGILLACEIGMIITEPLGSGVAIVLIAIGVTWIPLRAFRRSSGDLRGRWIFPFADLLVTIILILTQTQAFTDAKYLILAYVLISALLIGVVADLSRAVTWTTGVITALMFARLSQMPLPPVVSLASAAGVGAGVLLGNHLRGQLNEVGRLSAEVASARAEERALAERIAIARDLHDSLAKSVHGIRMLSETLNDSLQSEQHQDASLSRILFESADEASREARLVLDGLRVSGEDDVVGALTEEVTRWGARTGVEACIEAQETTCLQCAPEAVWQLQRILGEALANVEKHAHAHTVFFSARVDDGSLYIVVSDDGVGVEKKTMDKIFSVSSEGHYGLAGMRERAESLNAHLAIEARPKEGIGLRMHLFVPLESLTSAKERQE